MEITTQDLDTNVAIMQVRSWNPWILSESTAFCSPHLYAVECNIQLHYIVVNCWPKINKWKKHIIDYIINLKFDSEDHSNHF